MRGIVINPWISSVNEVQLQDSAEDLLKAMSWLGSEVNDVQVATPFPNGDNLLISKQVPSNYPGFLLGTFYCRGCGLILGSEDGKWRDAVFLLTDIQDRVRFK